MAAVAKAVAAGPEGNDQQGEERERWGAAKQPPTAGSTLLRDRGYGIVTLLAEQQEPFPDTEMTW